MIFGVKICSEMDVFFFVFLVWFFQTFLPEFFCLVAFFALRAVFAECAWDYGFYNVFCTFALCSDVVFSEFSFQVCL